MSGDRGAESFARCAAGPRQQGRARASEDFSRRRPRRRQDLRHAGGGAQREGRRPRRGGGPGRDARPHRDRATDRRLRKPAAQAGHLPQPGDEGVRSRRRAGAAAEPAAGRRIRPHQRAGQPASQALAGHRRVASRRHRRLDHAQHPASRKPQRRRAEDHQGAGARDRARYGVRQGRRDRAGGLSARRTAQASRRRQDLRAGHRGPRGRQFLSPAEPDRAARAGAAPRRRADRRRPDRAHAGAGDRRAVGGAASASSPASAPIRFRRPSCAPPSASPT